MSQSPRDPRADQRAWEDLVQRLTESEAPDDAEISAPEAPDPESQFPEPDEDWHPPDPGHVTAGLRLGTLVAWAAIMVVPVVLVILGFLMDGLPWWLWFPGLAVVISSVITLLGRLPEHRDDNDDGARV
ncbi:hypothetical protein [Kocuria sp.]|uniref:hypothetical protein n=1 Tax=Kocuria sp. TaxID=1871328 RepID=UPI0026DF188E|nr:hypothetical protein [Kocuria sp.]MDO5618470.1 hypothetical protein [Kocuria sp.]